MHSATGVSGRSGGVRGSVERRAKFSQPEQVRRRVSRGSGGTFYAGERRNLRADSDCVFAGDRVGGIVPARGGLYSAADRCVTAEVRSLMFEVRKSRFRFFTGLRSPARKDQEHEDKVGRPDRG